MTSSTQRPSTIRYRIIAWLLIAAALSYLCRNAVGVAESSIRTELGLSLRQSGWIMGAFFWSYAFSQIPSGWISQHYGTRLSLTVFALLSSLATLGMAVAPGLWMLIAVQLLMGVAQAGFFPASCQSIGHWMPMSQRSMACGYLTAGMQVGAISASALAGMLLMSFPWRWIFVFFSVPGFLWAMLFYIRFRNQPEQNRAVNSQELDLIRNRDVNAEENGPVPAGRFHSWQEIVWSVDIWLICGQQICRSIGYMFFASWFPTFLQSTRGLSISSSGQMQGIVLAGTLTGSLVGGYVTDWIWVKTGNLRLSRCGRGALALFGCGFLVLGAWFVENANVAIALLALGSFFAAIAGPCMFATVIDIGGKRTPEIFGLVNMVGNIASAACPILIGEIFERTSDWNLVLLLFAGIYLAGAVCWAFVIPERKETLAPPVMVPAQQ